MNETDKLTNTMKDTDKKIQTGPLTRELMLAVGNAIRRVNELRQQRIVTPGAQEEIHSAQAFIGHVLSQNANELVGTWLACNSEYTPLVEGIAALLRRAHVQNERLAQQVMARVQSSIVTPDAKPEGCCGAKCGCKATEPTKQESEDETAAIEQSASHIILGTFGEATKTGAPIAPVTP